jgi:hypothetical protein
LVAAEPAGEIVEVGEVPGFGAAEQGQVLRAARSRTLKVGPRSVASTGSSGGLSRPRSTMRLSPLPVICRRTKSLVDHSLVRPSAFADRGFERGGGGRDRGRGCVEEEQVDVSGLALDQALLDERGAAGVAPMPIMDPTATFKIRSGTRPGILYKVTISL